MRIHPLRWYQPTPDSALDVATKARPLQWYGPANQGDFIIEFTCQNRPAANPPSVERVALLPDANGKSHAACGNRESAPAANRRRRLLASVLRLTERPTSTIKSSRRA